MPSRDVHLPVSAQPSLRTIVDLATRAERSGYDRVWFPETWGRDAVTTLATIAGETETVGIGTSVVNVFARSPAILGQTAATLQEASGGRFRLGLGPSAPALVEGWHGIRFAKPLRRTRETIEIVRQVLSGDVVTYDGDVFTLSGVRLRCDPPTTPPAIDAAGMGPTSVELAGRFADGWHAITLTPDGVRERLADLRHGAELGGRRRDDPRVTVSVLCCALTDGERARNLAREHLAFYVGSMGTYYRESLSRQGYASTATEIASAWANGERERATQLIDDDLLDGLAAVGTPGHARESLDRFERIDDVDAVAVGFPRGATPMDATATVDALAP